MRHISEYLDEALKDHFEVDKKLHGNATHGLSNSKEYSAWSHMRQRCLSSKYYLYDQYGGRGITVCDRWINSFETFLLDVGLAPSKNHTLDRINSDGNYEPLNVRWADWKTQQRNRRNNRVIEINGSSKSLAEWCEIYGIGYQKVWARISKLGMDPLEALTTGYIKRGPNGRA